VPVRRPRRFARIAGETLPAHGHRFRTVTRAVILGALLASAVLVAPVTARAVSPGSGGWYWPVGTEDFQGWDGWWTYRPQSPPRWHMAQDMPAPVGHAVYAVGDGTVLESGPGHGYGGVLVVLHRTGDGHYFKAVYGHIIRAAGTSKGATVHAGQIIGRVNGARHLHFGIHPGLAYPPDRNPYRGHTYTSRNTYGWVDPVAYLRSNPRVVGCPDVPVVAAVETTTRPTVLGVADGSVFWSIESSGLPQVFARALPGGETMLVAADAALPSLDATRFPVRVGAASFTLADRLPRLTMTASSASPAWRHSVTLSGRLANALGAPFVGATVALESTVDGENWTRLSTALTGPTGRFSVRWVPSRRSSVRARFEAPPAFLPALSVPTTLAPKPALSAPVAPARAARGRTFTARGSLAPRHPAGPTALTLRVQRRIAGAWVDYAFVPTTCRDSASASVYEGSLSLPAGSWRMRAESPSDALHSDAVSAWTAFVVR
jgi:hypothetical protein